MHPYHTLSIFEDSKGTFAMTAWDLDSVWGVLTSVGAANTIVTRMVVLVVTACCLYYYLAYTKTLRASNPLKLVPGWIPILGHFHWIGGIQYAPLTIESKWCDVYGAPADKPGCFELDLVGKRVVVICREDRLNELLPYRLPGKMERQANINEAANSIGATGLFSATSDNWKRERKLVSATLNHANLADYLAVMKDMAARLIQKWHVAAAEHAPVNAGRDLGHMTADTIARVAMDRDFDFLNDPDSQIAADVNRAMGAVISRALSPVWFWRIPLLGQYLDGNGGAIRRMQKLIYGIVKKQEELQAAEPDDGAGSAGKKFFLQKLLSLMYSEKTKLERDRLTGNVLTLFLGATDTTSKTLTHALYILARDPVLQSMLRREVDGFVNRTENGNADNNNKTTKAALETATMNDLYTKLPQLKSFLHEVHRHYGSPFTNWKTCVDLPFCGSTLPAGSNVMVMIRYICTNSICPSKRVPNGPNGEAPHVFCAERYLEHVPDDSGGTTLTCPNPATQGGAFGTFGNGLRVCPGRSYAEIFSYLVLISLLHNFELELTPDHPLPTQRLYDVVIMPGCDQISLMLTAR